VPAFTIFGLSGRCLVTSRGNIPKVPVFLILCFIFLAGISFLNSLWLLSKHNETAFLVNRRIEKKLTYFFVLLIGHSLIMSSWKDSNIDLLALKEFSWASSFVRVLFIVGDGIDEKLSPEETPDSLN